MIQNNPDRNMIYYREPIDKMLFTKCQYDGQFIPSVVVTYAKAEIQDVFVATVNEMNASQQWSHDLAITDSDVSILFHCYKLSPEMTFLLTSGMLTELPENAEIAFDCSADFNTETIEIFREEYNNTNAFLFQIVDSLDNIHDGKLRATTLAALLLPVPRVH